MGRKRRIAAVLPGLKLSTALSDGGQEPSSVPGGPDLRVGKGAS